MFNRNNLMIVVVALAAGLGLWLGQKFFFGDAEADLAARMQSVRLFSQTKPLPPFELQQSGDRLLTNVALQGRWSLVYIGFASCPDVCPTSLGDLAIAQKDWASVDAKNRPQVLLVSVDPERDTPDSIAQYAAFFHPDTVAATHEDIDTLTEFTTSLGMVFAKVPMGDSYTMDHSNMIALINPRGEMAGLIRPESNAGAQQIAHYNGAAIAADLRILIEAQP